MVVAAGLGLVLVVFGVVLMVTSEAVSFGWFAYAPLAEDPVISAVGDAVVLTRQQAAGAGVVVVGAVVLAGATGWAVGRRQPHR